MKIALKIVCLTFFVSLPACAQETLREHYQMGSQVSQQLSVYDKGVELKTLAGLLKEADKPVNIVFLFGGGALGFEKAAATGGLWCPDSYEDMHIVRSLAQYYGEKIAVFPIAVPPVFHAKQLGFPKNVFFDSKNVDQATYKQARSRFIESTEAAFIGGVIPVQPFYDLDFNLLASAALIFERSAELESPAWHGAFRAINESQHYGVPNLWLIDNQGKILYQPFRGNLYRAHGAGLEISYTLMDVVSAIDELL